MIIWLHNTWTKWCIHAQYKIQHKNSSWDLTGPTAVEIPAPMAGSSSELDQVLPQNWTLKYRFYVCVITLLQREISLHSVYYAQSPLCIKITEENLPWNKKDPLQANKITKLIGQVRVTQKNLAAFLSSEIRESRTSLAGLQGKPQWLPLRQQVSLEQMMYRPLLAEEGNIGSAFCVTMRWRAWKQ